MSAVRLLKKSGTSSYSVRDDFDDNEADISPRHNEGAAANNENEDFQVDQHGEQVGVLSDWRIAAIRDAAELDSHMGFSPLDDKESRCGWLVNMQPTLVLDTDYSGGKAGIDFYFICEDASTFKATILYEPYFYLICKPGSEMEVEEYLLRRFERQITTISREFKDDLTLTDHLIGYKQTVLKLSFFNVANLLAVRKVLSPVVERNKKSVKALHVYQDISEIINQKPDHAYLPGLTGASESSHLGSLGISHTSSSGPKGPTTAKLKASRDSLDAVLDLREFDVTYYVRAAMDNDFRVGYWYNVKQTGGQVTIERRNDRVERADPVVLAFDIETTKLPLKFPDSAFDNIMMISYMIDGQGYLITNREIVGEDITDFEYTPKAEFSGPFTIFNELDEKALIQRFFDHIKEARPNIFVTYNGDFFDWPFVEARAKVHGFNMKKEIGFSKNISGVYASTYAAHMDALCWVKRDSYLPVGSQGLKAVTTNKLGYNPMEIDPEDMTRFATEQPQTLAQYSVSDAVATYYLYMKYVHPFIFSLCNIIPMHPDDVLRRGSGTLCETLLMVEAFKANILMPNKHADETGKTFEGHLIESETYVGGHVEALEAGVFRSDLPCKFKLVPEAFDTLIEEIDRALIFSIVEEGKLKVDDVTNYSEVRDQIIKRLQELRDDPIREEGPLIYHLDVAAMYPNIILTNRLQPDAIVDEGTCAGCHYNEGPETQCQRKLTWSWRGEYFPASRAEYNMIRNQLETEKFPKSRGNDSSYKSVGYVEKHSDAVLVPFHELSHSEQNALIKKRVAEYSRKVYGKVHENKVVPKESIVCQRENSFYVDTVRSFRDRRYEYKGLLKTWKKNLDNAAKSGDAAALEEAKKLTVVFDSLQLAHKCILNSFYGYVMRRGARWFSMEMAGIVCLTGAKIIQLARTRIDQIGRPLELDTDGIWCILPKSFPEQFTFKLGNGKQYPISYPCVMLNHLVHDKFTNHQYHELKPQNFGVTDALPDYEVRSENSIFFEVDGPYRAMILPASTEEDKLLKKRYAVFNHDGSLAELKGFEVKRRGELKLVKIFQSQIFSMFLDGSTLEECYAAVATLADAWLDVLYSKGADLTDAELIDLISENRSMSKSLAEYGAQKSTSISTAKRLAELLGDQMVKDKGLNCKFIISSKPPGLPVSERAIPVAIFQDAVDPQVRRHFLKKWLKDSSNTNFDIRAILDWQYYLERFGAVIQKVITIPAAMQKVANPVPRVQHPDWLLKRLAARDDRFKQNRITDIFKPLKSEEKQNLADISPFINSVSEDVLKDDLEDLTSDINRNVQSNMKVSVVHKRAKKRVACETEVIEDESDVIVSAPTLSGSYSDWLDYQKKKWRRRRGEIQAQNELFGDDTRRQRRKLGGSSVSSNVESFFRKQTESVVTKTWEVLQIAATDQPGEFRLWAIIDDQLHKLRLLVPRIFYVNSRTPDPAGILTAAEAASSNVDSSGRPQLSVNKRTRILPRSHPCYFLYECVMPEKFYLDNMVVFSSLFNHPSVEGVYETKTPLMFRAITHLSCLLEVTKERRAFGPKLEDGFHIFDLDRATPVVSGPTRDHPYLNPQRISKLNSVYLYHSSSGNNTCQIFGIFFSTSSRNSMDQQGVSSLAKVFIVDPGRNRDQVPNIKKIYQDCGHLFVSVDEKIPNHNHVGSTTPTKGMFFKFNSNLDFDFDVLSTEKQALSEVNKCLREYQQQQRGPAILLLQSPRTPRQLIHGPGGETNGGITAINDFPYITMPAHKQDRAFPAIGWQIPGIRRMFSHLSHLDVWLQDQIVLSRYADVPLCNLEQDYLAFMADVFLARKLHKHDMLQWMSLTGIPDLGGHEEDDHHFEIDELMDPEINVPGIYPSVCIEIDIHELAQNSIVLSYVVNETEGTTNAGFEKTPHLMDQHLNAATGTTDIEGNNPSNEIYNGVVQNVADYNNFSAHTFSIIRSLIKTWEVEASQNKNRIAGLLLGHLHRWIAGGGGTSASAASSLGYASFDGSNTTSSTAASRYFDPALRDMVHSIMRKVFLQLLGEFRRLGSTIIHARFDKLVISTSKNNSKAAEGYINYVLQTIQKNKLFGLLDLHIRSVYEVALWMDFYNFGALVKKQKPEVIQMDVDPSVEDSNVLETGGNMNTPKLINKRKIESDSEEDEEKISLKQPIMPKEPPVQVSIISVWDIMGYLPVALHDSFIEIVHEYITKLSQITTSTRKKLPNNHQVLKENQDRELPNGGSATTANTADEVATALQPYIRSEFKRLLLEMVGKITTNYEQMRREMHGIPDSQWIFPVRPGSHMDPPPSNNPALEFVKSVCAVVGLEMRKSGGVAHGNAERLVSGAGGDGLQRQVQNLKRDLLNLIGVREFAPEARFINPCHSFRLPLVVCEYCHVVRELDLTRDPNFTESGIEEENSQQRKWECSECGYQHDKYEIEQRLIDIMQQRLASWQMQDIKCRRCRAVKAENMSLTCTICLAAESSTALSFSRKKGANDEQSTSGFGTATSLQVQKRILRVFKNIAEIHRMEMLGQVVQWIMSFD